MKGILVAILTIIIFPTLAYAEPVYLECDYHATADDSHHPFSLRMDESSGEITHTEENGDIPPIISRFTEDTIIYQMDKSEYVAWQYRINRSTLEVRVFEISKLDNFTNQNGRGECKIVDVKGRKFK